jgi:hypothetical protein
VYDVTTDVRHAKVHQLMGHPEQSGPELWHGAGALLMASSFIAAADQGIGIARRLSGNQGFRSSFDQLATSYGQTKGCAGALRRNKLHRRWSQAPFQ